MMTATAYRTLSGRLARGPVQSPSMSSRTQEARARARAEARRRARLTARGEVPAAESATTADDGVATGGAAPAPQPASRGLLGRIFPAAPPLPNRPDPLAGFDHSGPLRPVRERLFLLRRNPLAWIVPGVLAFFGFFASIQQTVLGLVGMFVLFGALIGAGWFGWQRPTLFGTTAALLSFFASAAVILWTFASRGAGPDAFGGPPAVVVELTLQAAYQAGLGFLGGWYGGYLRRRQAQIAGEVRRRR